MMSARNSVARISAVILLIAVAAMLLGCGLFDDGQKPEAATLVEPTPSATTLASVGPQSPAYDGASSLEERNPEIATSVEPPPATTSTSVAPASLAYDGPISLESRILASPVIAKVRLDSVTSTTESGPTVQGTKYILLLEFNFSVLEYLKGSGSNDIVAVWNSDQLFGTRQEAEAALPAVAATRDAQWDDHEAVVFLKHSQTHLASTQRAGRYYLSGVVLGSFGLDDNYGLASRYNKLWLPAEASVDATSQPSGDQQRFLMDAPPSTGTAPTMTLGEMKTRIAAVQAKLDASDGSEEYMECVSRTYWYEGKNSYSMATEGRGYHISTPSDHELGSGLAASTAVYEDSDLGGLPNILDELWLDGGDSSLFSVQFGDPDPYDFSGDGVNDTIQYARRVIASRPIPEGAYMFHFNHRDGHFVRCEGYTTRYEWTVTVNAPVGSLHEFFFDPVTDGAAVAADDTNGVLKPAAFTDANDAAAIVSRIEWESGIVKISVAPHTGLTDRFVDFIELDGTVSLSLAVSAVTVDAANNALSWSATTQPWEDGDLLMARIREPYAPAPTNLRSSRAGNGYLIAWNAVSGASQYALQTRIPGVQDWTDTTPFAEEDNQWYAPSQDLWCASSYGFRVRSYGDGIRYAAEWGEPSSVLVRDGHCNNDPEFSESAYSFSVAEDTSVGEPVGTVSATDLDALSYSITAGNGDGKFAIGESSGVISVAGELDHATTASYTLTVEASDGRGETDSATVEIEILSVVVDYDADDDGLIEVSALAQLNAIRWDLDGNGASTNTSHAAAFPRAPDGMGCPSTGCKGYELTTDLDFDTDGDGSADSEDDYWNDGSGWDPIGDSSNEFRAIFDGNGRSLSNLFIDRDSTDRVGLFANTGGLSTVRNVRLVSADVTGRDVVGGIVGYNDDSRVTSVCVSGDVAGRDYVGGITGRNDGAVRNGCSSADVSGDDYVGGIVGWNYEIMTNGYATGDVSGDTLVGGLVGRNDAIMTNGYATGDVTASREAGGLVGRNEGRITNGYATGSVTASSQAGGLVGSSHRRAQVSASYWDTDASGLSASAGGVGKTTGELQSPTTAVGIYSAWDTAVWDFGTSAQYPALKVDVDGDSTSTWGEFGDQGR